MGRREFLASLSALAASQLEADDVEHRGVPGHGVVSTGVVTPERLRFHGDDGISGWNIEGDILEERRLEVLYDQQGIQLTVDGANTEWEPLSVGDTNDELRAGTGVTLTNDQARELAVALFAAAEQDHHLEGGETDE